MSSTQPSGRSNWAAVAAFSLLVLAVSSALKDQGAVFSALLSWAAVVLPVVTALAVHARRRNGSQVFPVRSVALVFGGFSVLSGFTLWLSVLAPPLQAAGALLTSIILPAVAALSLLSAPGEPAGAAGRRTALALLGCVLALSAGVGIHRYRAGHDSGATRNKPRPRQHVLPSGVAFPV